MLPQFVTSDTAEAVMKEIRDLEARGCISTNLDSVDGLPSLHLNLVSRGKPMQAAPGTNNDDFQNSLDRLLSLVRDPVYTVLLPRVRELMHDPSIQVSDIFVRRYGQDICHVSRRGYRPIMMYLLESHL